MKIKQQAKDLLPDSKNLYDSMVIYKGKQGVSKNLLEYGAHKTPFLDTFTRCVGCWHMFIY